MVTDGALSGGDIAETGQPHPLKAKEKPQQNTGQYHIHDVYDVCKFCGWGTP